MSEFANAEQQLLNVTVPFLHRILAVDAIHEAICAAELDEYLIMVLDAFDQYNRAASELSPSQSDGPVQRAQLVA